MADKKLLRKIAPIIMSAAVAMTSSPVGVMAEDFTSGEVSVEVSDETIYDSDEISDDYDESSEADDSADFGTDTEDGFESEKPQKRSLDLRTAKPETQKMLF